jgi:hypothetical protein
MGSNMGMARGGREGWERVGCLSFFLYFLDSLKK